MALVSGLAFLISAAVALYSATDSMQQSAGTLPPPQANPPVATTVAIAHDMNDPPTNAEIEQMVRQAVQAAGGLAGLHSGATVVIKPNLVQTQWPAGEGVTTDPRVVRAIVRLAQEAGASRIMVAEGTASSRSNEYLGRGVTWKAFKDSGYDADGDHRDDETGVELYDLNDTGSLDLRDPAKVALVTIPNGVIRTQYWVPRVLLRPEQGGSCDFLISVPTLKNHQNGGVTLSLKNRVGCAPSDIYHADFAPYTQQMKWSLVHSGGKFPRTVVDGGLFVVPPATDVENAIVQYTIVDLNLVRPQDFAVVDGLVGIKNGPVGTSGTLTKAVPPRKLIIAGRDSVAVDTVGSLVMGYDPTQTPQIAWADNRGLGTMDTSSITVVGSHVASVRQDFPNGYGGEIRADSVPPILNSISLTQGQQVSGLLTITGNASDNAGLARVELSLVQSGHEDIVAAVANPPGSFTLDWDSNTVTTGLYLAKVTVYDAALNEASTTRDIEVTRPPLPVIVPSTSSLGQTVLITTPSSDTFTIRNSGVGALNYGIQADQPWVHVSPAGGVANSETNTITVSYDSDVLVPGTHTAVITVSDPAAYNNPRTIAVSLTIRPAGIDFDGDGDVDQADFGRFQACLTGPGNPQTDAACAPALLDQDSDVDGRDLELFRACMGPPGFLVPAACAK